MSPPLRSRRPSRPGWPTWFAGVAWIGVTACAGSQSQSAYQQQQQAMFYDELLQQQAQAQQAAQVQQAAEAQAATQAQAAATIQQQAMALAASPDPAPAKTPAVSLPVARIDGQPIAASELAAHQTATGLPRAAALTDLIDLTLLRSAATQQRLPVANGSLAAEARTDLERALSERLELGLPAWATAAMVHSAVRGRLLEGKIVEILEIPALQ